MSHYIVFQFRKVQLILLIPTVETERTYVSIPQGPINTGWQAHAKRAKLVSIPQGPINTKLINVNSFVKIVSIPQGPINTRDYP